MSTYNFKEGQISTDLNCKTADQTAPLRAARICQLIISKKVKFPHK